VLSYKLDRQSVGGLMRRRIEIAAGVFVLALAGGCSDTPTAPSVWSPDQVRQQLLASNLNHAMAGARGRLTRWRLPIAVDTNNIARASEALNHYEQWSGGVIRFQRVSGSPPNGLVFVEGGAREVDQGCSDVRNTGTRAFTPEWDGDSALIGAYTIHLGSEGCNDESEGRYGTAFAEHVLAHALGIFDHFDGFTGPEGLVDAHAFAVIHNLYANPIGATAAELVIWPAILP
jgi:hypothetical protein